MIQRIKENMKAIIAAVAKYGIATVLVLLVAKVSLSPILCVRTA